MYGIEFEVRDLEQGHVLGSTQQEAMHVRGYTPTSGHWGKPEATAEVLDDDAG